MMRRWIIGLLCAWLVMTGVGCFIAPSVMAQAVLLEIDQTQARQINQIRQKAFTATEIGDFAAAEEYWGELIELLPDNAVGWSNRGNTRVAQNKLDEAIADFNQAIELAPEAADPYLNRGTAYEALERWEDAIADYQTVLVLDPKDAMAYNNLGNAKAGQGKWQEALANYKKATQLAPNFVTARSNYAIALYQIGEEKDAIRQMRNIVRKYPQFPDMRAALTAALWTQGQRGEAESNWVAVVGLDQRYKDIDWVKNIRRWPPALVEALEKFLTLS